MQENVPNVEVIFVISSWKSINRQGLAAASMVFHVWGGLGWSDNMIRFLTFLSLSSAY